MPTVSKQRSRVTGVSCPVSNRRYWPFFFQMLCHRADGDAEAVKIRIVGIFRDEPHVGDHIRNPQTVSEIRSVAQVLDAHLPVFRRNQPEGELPVIKIPDHGPGQPHQNAETAMLYSFKRSFKKRAVFLCPRGRCPGNELQESNPLSFRTASFAGISSGGRKVNAGADFHEIPPRLKIEFLSLP